MDSRHFYTLEGKELMPRTDGARFLVFEGIDGSGKSTAAKLLYERLNNEGFRVILTKEPSLATEAGKKIREILTGKMQASVRERQQLFTDDRKEHLERVIMPALKEGKVVISDRYFFSTLAFGAGTGVDLEWLVEINKNFVMPDIAFLITVSPQVGLQRIRSRGQGAELHDKLGILERVGEAYAALAVRFPNIKFVNGERSIEEVSQEIISLTNTPEKEA